MMCVELRIRCSQPPSRGFSDSLPTPGKASRRSPELRHQLVVFLSDLRPESASERKNAASFPVYLYWAFSGVTPGRQQVPQSAWHHDVCRTSSQRFSASLQTLTKTPTMTCRVQPRGWLACGPPL